MVNGKNTKKKTEANARLHKLMEDLMGENIMAREKARVALTEIGVPAIDFLAELAYSSNDKFRWESIKALSEISDPDVIPFLLDALDDNNAGIRWLAAEGLIRIGDKAVQPLLEALIGRSDAFFLYQGAHHVLHGLRRQEYEDEISLLLAALKEPSVRITIMIAAGNLLRKLKVQMNQNRNGRDGNKRA